MEETQVLLSESETQRSWDDIQADLPSPLPPVLPSETRQPVGPADLAPIFPMGSIQQEVGPERYLEIPDEVLDTLHIWRPGPPDIG